MQSRRGRDKHSKHNNEYTSTSCNSNTFSQNTFIINEKNFLVPGFYKTLWFYYYYFFSRIAFIFREIKRFYCCFFSIIVNSSPIGNIVESCTFMKREFLFCI